MDREIEVYWANKRVETAPKGEKLRSIALQECDEKIAAAQAELDACDSSQQRLRWSKRIAELEADRERIRKDGTYSNRPGQE